MKTTVTISFGPILDMHNKPKYWAGNAVGPNSEIIRLERAPTEQQACEWAVMALKQLLRLNADK